MGSSKVRGKCVNLFLMSGSVTGSIKCSLANWTGLAYKIPRTDLDSCKNRPELKQSGVYFLFGKSDVGDELVYIGQAGIRKNGEGVLNRLYEHRRDKDYWTEAIIFITSDNSFGPTEISYLENRFVERAKEAARYETKNSIEPTAGNITEEKESELEEFLENAELIMGTLGHKIFIPKNEILPSSQENESLDNQEIILYLTTKKASAQGKRTSDGFVIFKGSKVAQNPTRSCPDAIKSLRKKYAEEIDANLLLTEDILFTSPSTAAAFANFASANGLIMWKNAIGQTLKELEECSPDC